eukprot:scaffold731_cov261-Pinguiococcus_pyrenoidosus.AAC.49
MEREESHFQGPGVAVTPGSAPVLGGYLLPVPKASTSAATVSKEAYSRQIPTRFAPRALRLPAPAQGKKRRYLLEWKGFATGWKGRAEDEAKDKAHRAPKAEIAWTRA